METNHSITIIVSLQVAGIHSWPTCPLPDVDYLKSPHRHVFYIKGEKSVQHGDREVEIISLKNDILRGLKKIFPAYRSGEQELDFGPRSCEHIAAFIANQWELQMCEVLEDGENGARIVVYDDLPF